MNSTRNGRASARGAPYVTDPTRKNEALPPISLDPQIPQSRRQLFDPRGAPGAPGPPPGPPKMGPPGPPGGAPIDHFLTPLGKKYPAKVWDPPGGPPGGPQIGPPRGAPRDPLFGGSRTPFLSPRTPFWGSWLPQGAPAPSNSHFWGYHDIYHGKSTFLGMRTQT